MNPRMSFEPDVFRRVIARCAWIVKRFLRYPSMDFRRSRAKNLTSNLNGHAKKLGFATLLKCQSRSFFLFPQRASFETLNPRRPFAKRQLDNFSFPPYFNSAILFPSYARNHIRNVIYKIIWPMILRKRILSILKCLFVINLRVYYDQQLWFV